MDRGSSPGETLLRLQLWYGDRVRPDWVWVEEPQAQALVCSPVIDQATATVTVDMASGRMQNYTINGTPKNATGAWTDNNVGRAPLYAATAS